MTQACICNLGLTTDFFGFDFSKYEGNVAKFTEEFSKRANQKGQFLNWVNLPQEQIKRVDEIYTLAEKLKNPDRLRKTQRYGYRRFKTHCRTYVEH